MSIGSAGVCINSGGKTLEDTKGRAPGNLRKAVFILSGHGIPSGYL